MEGTEGYGEGTLMTVKDIFLFFFSFLAQVALL